MPNKPIEENWYLNWLNNFTVDGSTAVQGTIAEHHAFIQELVESILADIPDNTWIPSETSFNLKRGKALKQQLRTKWL